MNRKSGDLLNFTLNETGVSPIPNKDTKSCKNLLLLPENDFIKSGDGRKSLDNNPFDKVCKQVETFSADPFEFVTAQSTNFKPVISCIRTGNLIDLGGDNKENNNNERNETSKDNVTPSPKKVTRKSKANETGSGKKRDSLLKLSLANASKLAMPNDGVVEENQMGEKWMNMEIPDDSFNDLMKQEIVLVDSDVSLNDYDTELNIPILKELDEIKKGEKSPSVEEETVTTTEIMSSNDTHNNIIDRAIAKLNEIKLAKTQETNLDDTMVKLREMVSKVDEGGKGEASLLLEQLCAALNKKQKSSNKNLLEPPPTMIRQGTFDIDKTEENIDSSNNSESNSPQLQTVIDKLSEVLGNVNMNVIQSSPDNPHQPTNPVVVVVVNPESGFGMSDTVTLANHHNFNTPQPKPRTRRSQSFSSAARPTVAPNLLRRESISYGTPQRNVQPTRRSFSFNSPAAPIPKPRTSILPSQKPVPAKPAPSASLSKPGTSSRLSFMDKLKPKIGFPSNNAAVKNSKSVPLKISGPLKVIHREKSPDTSMKSLTNTSRQIPMAQSTPMSRIATPQKPSRVSFLTTPNRPPGPSSTLTVPRQQNVTNLKRRSSFNDKDKPPTTSTNLKPKTGITRPSTGGLLTHRKFPQNKGPSTNTRTGGITQQQPLKLKLRK